MNVTILVAVVIALGFAAAFVAVFRRLLRADHAAPVDAAWLAAFSPARYLPMARLLNVEDLAFLGAQPGSTRACGQKFRAERRVIFRKYLRNLARDFERLHRAARMLLLCAPQDRPDYAAALVRQRIRFAATVVLVRWRLLLNWIGGAAVDTSPLVEALEAMNAQVRELAAAPALAAY
jgi:hypothetical protein